MPVQRFPLIVVLPLNVELTTFTVRPLGIRVAVPVFPEKVELVIVALCAVSANLITPVFAPTVLLLALKVQRVTFKVPANNCIVLSAVLLLFPEIIF